MCVLNPDNDGARIKAISIGLRDSGFEVIYTGSENNIDQIINTAMQEDVDAIGICSYSNKDSLSSFMKKIEEKEMNDLSVFVEGSLSKKEISEELVQRARVIGKLSKHYVQFFKGFQKQFYGLSYEDS